MDKNHCDQAELVCAYAMRALPSGGVPQVEAHISSCSQCRRELETLRPILDAFVFWPTDVLRPAASLQERLARRISTETGGEPAVDADVMDVDREDVPVADAGQKQVRFKIACFGTANNKCVCVFLAQNHKRSLSISSAETSATVATRVSRSNKRVRKI